MEERYTLAEIRGYIVTTLALLVQYKVISEAEGFKAMKVFNSVILTLSDPRKKQTLDTLQKAADAEHVTSQDKIIAELLKG